MRIFRLYSLLLFAFLLVGCGETAVKEVAKATEEKAEPLPEKPEPVPEKAEPVPKKAEPVAEPEPECFFIDVRSHKEWDEGHLDTTIHIPHTEIVEGIAAVTEDKNAKIFVY